MKQNSAKGCCCSLFDLFEKISDSFNQEAMGYESTFSTALIFQRIFISQ